MSRRCVARVDRPSAQAGPEWRVAFVLVHLGGFAGLVAWLRTAQLDTRVLLTGAVLFRLIALPMLPGLSDDGYRYLWDGRAVVELGVSPYEYRPSDPAFSALHSGVEYDRMNSRDFVLGVPARLPGRVCPVRVSGRRRRLADRVVGLERTPGTVRTRSHLGLGASPRDTGCDALRVEPARRDRDRRPGPHRGARSCRRRRGTTCRPDPVASRISRSHTSRRRQAVPTRVASSRLEA